MSRFIETIRLQEGRFVNLAYHQDRFNRTRRELLHLRQHPVLEEVLEVPDGLGSGLFKYRITYGKKILKLEIEPYERRGIGSLKLVHADRVGYSYKFSDRDPLLNLFGRRGICDDILIVLNGCITDSLAANVVFWDGSSWITPDTPLLAGTMRASLLDRGILKETRITENDMDRYEKVRLINAMNDLEEGSDIPVSAIIRG